MNEIDDNTTDDQILRVSVGPVDNLLDQLKTTSSVKKIVVKRKSKSCKCEFQFNFIMIFFILLIIFFLASIIYYSYLKYTYLSIKTILSNSDIIHSLYDKSYYQVITLSNSVTVLMVLMQNLNFTAFSMSIESGSEDDEIPGLAHLSYQLYMQDLQKGKFNNIVKSNLGTINGNFNDNLTSFYFEVEKNQFLQTIIEFAEIFNKQSNYNDEDIRSAIDKIDSGFWRDYHDENILTRQAGITIAFNGNRSYFPSGNKETFGTNYTKLKQSINQYRKKNFVGNKIKLVFHSDQLPYYIKGIAIKFFSHFPKSDTNELNVNKANLIPLNLGKIGFAEIDSSFYHNIALFFYFNKTDFPEYEYYLKYVQYLLNDKKIYNFNASNPNDIRYSLIKMYRHLNLANNVTTSIKKYNSSIIEFKLEIDTTILADETIGNLGEIIATAFSYFLKIQNDTPLDLIKERYEDFSKIMYYNFKMRPFTKEYALYTQNTANDLIEHIYHNSSSFLLGNNYLPNYNETIIKGILNNFVPEKAIIIVSTNNILKYDENLHAFVSDKCNLTNYSTESVYNMKYSSCDINIQILIENADLRKNDFQIRSKNEFITDIVMPITSQSEFNKSNNIEVHNITKRHFKFYHKQDLTFNVPKVGFFLHMISLFTRPLSFQDAVLNLYAYQLYSTLIEEKLGDAMDAGNRISIQNNENSYDNAEYYELNYNLSAPIHKEILGIKFKRQHEKYFNIYQILMKRNVSNLFDNDNQTFLFNGSYNQLRSKVRDVLIDIYFYGDILVNQSETIINNTVLKYIDIESVSLEFKYEQLSYLELANFFHQQHYFKGYHIGRYSSQLEDEDSYLINNVYLLGNYSNQVNEDATLLYYIIGSKICENVLSNSSIYFASFNLYKYDGAMSYSFVVQGKKNTTLLVNDDEFFIKNVNIKMDYAIDNAKKLIKNATDNYDSYEGDLYLAREMYIRNYWKPEVCLEERTSSVFNLFYLNITEYVKGTLSRKHFKNDDGTFKDGKSIMKLYDDIFYSNVSKLSIQLFNYNESIPMDEEEYELNKNIKSKTIINKYDLGLDWSTYTTPLK